MKNATPLHGKSTRDRYGNRMLKSIAGLAKDTCDRLSAEFRAQDLHASFVALDVEAWQIVYDSDNSSTTFTGPAYAKPPMAGAIRRTFAALGLEFVAKDWGQIVQTVLEIRKRMVERGARWCVDAQRRTVMAARHHECERQSLRLAAHA